MAQNKDDVVDLRDEKKQKPKPVGNKKIVGLDIGTMNLVAAIHDLTTGQTSISSMRNMFLEIEKEIDADLSDIDHIAGDGKNYIFGEHALRFANIFGGTPRRPMQNGLISTGEMDAIDIMSMMIENLIGRGNGDFCIYSVPAPPVDSDMNVIYHEQVFGRVLKQLGYNPRPQTQALSVIYSQCEKEKFSGIAIDFGSGMCNSCVAYRRNPALEFSTSRSGDWIDREAAKSLGVTAVGRVTALKEKELNLSNPMIGNKKERRIREALVFYYQNLINYTLKHISRKFAEISDQVDIPEKLPIVVSGGTSKAEGFLEFFRDVFETFDDFPVEVSEIRHAEDPLTAVAEGCLIRAISDSKK
jgi:hypothetical protein